MFHTLPSFATPPSLFEDDNASADDNDINNDDVDDNDVCRHINLSLGDLVQETQGRSIIHVQEHSLTTILDSGSMELPVGGEVLILIILILNYTISL